MSRCLWTSMVVVAVGLFSFSACQLTNKTPAIRVSPTQVQPGVVVRVSGQNWRPGEQVTIGLNAPHARAQDSKPVTTVLTDASGTFVALFSFPKDAAWNTMREVWLLAHTRDFGKVVVAILGYAQPATVTPVPISTAAATPSAASPLIVLGYVVNTSVTARVIKLRPLEGDAEVISVVGSTRISRDGRAVEFEDVHIGDLIEASGQVAANNSMLADSVRILLTATVQPTATTAPTLTQSALVWRGEYYNNTTFSGSPVLVRDDPVIDFQWQEGAAVGGLATDRFAVRWTGMWPFESGTHRFYTQVDDGVRLWLDEHSIVDQWHESSGALYSADAYLSANSHAVKVEYFEGRGSAHAKVWWEYRGPDAVQLYPDWKGEYYADIALSGTPFFVVNERLIDFEWGPGAPASGMPSDNFSARWTRSVHVEAGLYRFHARVDDGVRLWVDGTLVIDHWQDGPANTYFGDLYLSGDNHSLRAEYYEHTGQAVVQVSWELIPNTATPTSTPTQTPTSTPLPPTSTSTLTATRTLLAPTPVVMPTLTPLSSLRAPFTVYLPLATAPRKVAGRAVRAARGQRGGPLEDW